MTGAAEQTKTCRECDETKPLADFYPRSSKCSSCARKYQREYQAARKRGEKHLSDRWENQSIPIHLMHQTTRKSFWDQMRADLLAGLKKHGRFVQE